MHDSQLSSAIEAIIMVSDEPVRTDLLAEICEVSPQLIEEICTGLATEYEETNRGFILANVAGGWRYQSHPDEAPYVERFVLEGQSARLSGAALETLAIIAYKQPISRAHVASIRGVNADGVIKTLTQRGYVTTVGTDAGPGAAQLLGTTSAFLEKLGIASISDLPPLGDFVPGSDLVELFETGLRPNAPDLDQIDSHEMAED